ncbi:Putative LOC100333391 [Caligus rogercresseyi]|uniref:LOC100333391 n=1 Tax=Caligus rogercresseyi TaxID=217165 RepID=A0A7T8KDI6_CALRO|nr:Putative LOC100333391 [Caligus rogercresseyi]
MLKKKFSKVFKDAKQSVMKTTKVQVHLKEDVRPRYIRARPVPLALREKVCGQDTTEIMMVKSINAMETSETELRQAVAEDPELSIAVSAAETGDWSEVKENAFVRRRRELSLMNGLMFWGVRLVALKH